MTPYKAEPNADLEFSFPDALIWHELDQQGIKLPQGMAFVDLVIERDEDVLLVEIKDPSNTRCPEEGRKAYLKRLQDNSILTDELTPKARDSYTYMHLMQRDDKPLKYIVLIGIDAFDNEVQKALLGNFKDRLLADIRCECAESWKRHHISDCAVMSVAMWNDHFKDWPVTRLAAMAAAVPA